LKETLEKESEKEETPVASDQKPQPAPEEAADENAELSEEDISKLSPRAQKRIREQAAEIKRLAEETKESEKEPEPETPSTEVPDSQSFKNVKEFLSAVEDEPSRKLLEKFYGVIKGEISTTLAPIEQENKKAQFDQEFSKYEGINGLADYKADLRKTFLRTGKSVKELVGEVVTDLQLSRVKPIETTPSNPSHDGVVSIEGKSKDELYDILEAMKP